MNTIIVTAMVLMIAIFFYYVAIIRLKASMHKREKALNERGVTPSGSGLCHGMTLNKDRTGIKRDSKKSPAWYGRLA